MDGWLLPSPCPRAGRGGPTSWLSSREPAEGCTLEEGRGAVGRCGQGWLSLRARQCYESCLHLESFDLPKKLAGKFYSYSPSGLQEAEALGLRGGDLPGF